MILQQKTLEKLRELITHETEYRSGSVLVSFFNSLGFKDTYEQGLPSRWLYVDNKLSHINGTPQIDQCIKKLMSPINFIARLNEFIIKDFNQYLTFDGWKIIRESKVIKFVRACENDFESKVNIKVDDFLTIEFNEISLDKLGLDGVITDALILRFEEIKKCLSVNASLSVIFLSGSSLEGVLLGVAAKYPKEFYQTKSLSKNKDGKTSAFHQWALSNFIDVASEVGLLKENVKKFSHSFT